MFLLFFSKIIVYTDSNCKIITYYLIKQIFNHFNKYKKRGPFFKGTSYLIIYIALISAENIAGIHFILNIIQARVVAVGNDGLRPLLE